MRAVVQRVGRASVAVGDVNVAEIGPGLLVLLGVTHSDTAADAATLAGKVAGMRVFPDAAGKMNRSIAEAGGDVLVVSQFTLYGDLKRGRRPSFTEAAAAEPAAMLCDSFARQLEGFGISVGEGRFGEHMVVTLVNDGPVTLILESVGGQVR